MRNRTWRALLKRRWSQSVRCGSIPPQVSRSSCWRRRYWVRAVTSRRNAPCCVLLHSMQTATLPISCWGRLTARSARWRWRTASSNWQRKSNRRKPRTCRVDLPRSRLRGTILAVLLLLRLFHQVCCFHLYALLNFFHVILNDWHHRLHGIGHHRWHLTQQLLTGW